MGLFSLGGFFSDIWMSIWLSLNNFVYSIIGMLYRVFESVANVNLFSEEVFKEITSRIYIIMGIAMLFIFAYNLVLMIINPEEKKSTGQTTKVVKETIISLVLVILLPTIFNYMSIFQRHVLESGILSQIILGDTGGNSVEDCEKYKNYTIINDKTNIGDRQWNFEWYDWLANGTALLTGNNWLVVGSVGVHLIDFIQTPTLPTDYLYDSCLYSKTKSPSTRGAYSLPATIFSAFYHPTDYGFYECADFIENGDTSIINDPEEEEMCAYYYYDVKLSVFNGNIKSFNDESEFYSRVKADDGTFEFNGLMALAAGVLALYMFVCYTIAIGTRVAKLGFLQIISPIAVMMRIIPKQKEAMFDKWLKHLINTYLDVFIRLIIIYFSLFAVSLVPDVIKTLFKNIEGSWYVAALSTVVVILGILMFAQKAPELFKEFFGSAGNFALKSPSKQLSENKLAMGALGAIGGATSTAVKNIGKGNVLAGFGSGLVRGARAGYKSQNFKDLKYNTSGAIDRAIQAREDRDMRDNYTKRDKDGNIVARGALAYRANRISNAVTEWVSGSSLQSLQMKRDAIESVQKEYANVVSTTKDYVEGHKNKFKVNGKTIEQLDIEKEKALADFKNFNIDEFKAKLKKERPTISNEDLKRAAISKQESLENAVIASNKAYEDTVSDLTDALIARRRQEGVEDTKGIFVQNGLNIESDGDVINLGELISRADNTLNTKSNAIGDDIFTEMVGKTDKERRNTLGSHVERYNSEIANKRQQQSDKK